MIMGGVPRIIIIIIIGVGRINALVSPLVGDVHQTNA
jgi:dipeptide/tripeptide permease